MLHIRAVLETYDDAVPPVEYTSARMLTRLDWKYGRFRIRARLANCTGLGTWPAIWMLPTEWKYGGWPDSGEIDIMEHVGYDLGAVLGTVHTKAFNHIIGTQRGSVLTTHVEDWHVYDILWTEDRIDFMIDNVKYFEFAKVAEATSAEWPFDQNFHLILNVAVGGGFGGAKGVDKDAFGGFGQIMEIDYVRVYQLPKD
mmetsp:Transcript_12649/g.21496  ORF Transcript_12649/g.21496 Transcript_12649/m.21496 type:complete len:198 (-) Transcript_12649:66-659(-)